jgi:type I restriction enzyme S subunit
MTKENNSTSLRGTKQSVSLIPKLRFKEFENEWNKKRLDSINIKVIDGDRGKNYPNGNDFSNEGFCLFLNAKNVTKKGFSFAVTSFINKEKDLLLRKGKLKRFDIVLTTRGSVGHIAYYNENIHFENLRINSGMVLIRTDSKFIEPNYLNRYFRSNQIQNEIKKISFGSAQPQLTVGEIVKFKIAFPTFKEQQKIATFLTAVDTKIQQLTTKKQLLENYKKGVMQQLFSQQLRFKNDDGFGFPDWEEKRLGDLIEICSSKRVLQEDWKQEGVPFLRTREIINLSNNVSFKTPIFITEELFEELKLKYGVPKKGDILVSGVGTIGQLYIVKEDYKFYFKDGNVIWFKMNDSLDSNYLNQLFKTRFIKKQLSDNASITTVATFTIDGARKTKIIYPSFKEQQKIAKYLSAIDNKITTVQTQIDKTQTFKKGLLQGMFV